VKIILMAFEIALFDANTEGRTKKKSNNREEEENNTSTFLLIFY
jgi:hypothetical protein